MRTSVPMCGSAASKRSAWRAQVRRAALRIFLDTAVPIPVHLFRGRNLEWTHQAEPETLRVGFVPDAFRHLRILLLPRRIGTDASAAPERVSRVHPRSAADGLRIRLGRSVERIIDRRPGVEIG